MNSVQAKGERRDFIAVKHEQSRDLGEKNA